MIGLNKFKIKIVLKIILNQNNIKNVLRHLKDLADKNILKISCLYLKKYNSYSYWI